MKMQICLSERSVFQRMGERPTRIDVEKSVKRYGHSPRENMAGMRVVAMGPARE